MPYFKRVSNFSKHHFTRRKVLVKKLIFMTARVGKRLFFCGRKIQVLIVPLNKISATLLCSLLILTAKITLPAMATELNVTDDLIADGKNAANVLIMELEGVSGWTERIFDAGFVPAVEYASDPISGFSSRITNQTGQLRDSGYSIDIPTIGVPSGKSAYAYVEGPDFVIKASDLGQSRFSQMIADAKEMAEKAWYHEFLPDYLILQYEEERVFFAKYGINFIWQYPDGRTRVVTPAVLGGLLNLNDAESKGEVTIAYSMVIADVAATDSDFWRDVMIDKEQGYGDEPLPFLYDGERDGHIKGAIWLSVEEERGEGGGGCNAGTGVFGLLAYGLIALAGITQKKRWQ
jgi:hypothetical protein